MQTDEGTSTGVLTTWHIDFFDATHRAMVVVSFLKIKWKKCFSVFVSDSATVGDSFFKSIYGVRLRAKIFIRSIFIYKKKSCED